MLQFLFRLIAFGYLQLKLQFYDRNSFVVFSTNNQNNTAYFKGSTIFVLETIACFLLAQIDFYKLWHLMLDDFHTLMIAFQCSNANNHCLIECQPRADAVDCAKRSSSRLQAQMHTANDNTHVNLLATLCSSKTRAKLTWRCRVRCINRFSTSDLIPTFTIYPANNQLL